VDRTVGTIPVVSSDCVNCEKRPCGKVAGDEREKWNRTAESGFGRRERAFGVKKSGGG